MYSELAGASSQALSAPVAARLGLAKARLAGRDAEPRFVEAQEALARLGLVADALQAVLARDDLLVSARRHADRLPLLDEAERWARQALPGEPLVLAMLHNRHAVALDMAGRTEEALALNRATLVEYERELGSHHPSPRRSRSNVAVLLSKLGRNEEALEAQLAVLAEHEAARDDPSGTAISHESVADILVSIGRAGEAEGHCRKAMKIRETELPANHPDRPRGQWCLSKVLGALGNP